MTICAPRTPEPPKYNTRSTEATDLGESTTPCDVHAAATRCARWRLNVANSTAAHVITFAATWQQVRRQKAIHAAALVWHVCTMYMPTVEPRISTKTS